MIKLKSLLVEQTSVWNNITPSGTGADTEKRITTVIPSTNMLTDSNGNEIRLDSGPEGTPLYVGANIEAVYRENVNLKTKTDQITVYGGRFGCSIDLYVVSKQNTQPNLARTGQGGDVNYGIQLLEYKMIQQKNMKFQVVPYNHIINNNDIRFFAKTKTGKLYSGTSTATIGANISNNLSAYIGDVYTKINAELGRLGFPDLPSTINMVSATDI